MGAANRARPLRRPGINAGPGRLRPTPHEWDDDPPPGARVPLSPNPRRVSRMVRLQPRFVIRKSPVMMRESRFLETVASMPGETRWGGLDDGGVRVPKPQ